MKRCFLIFCLMTLLLLQACGGDSINAGNAAGSVTAEPFQEAVRGNFQIPLNGFTLTMLADYRLKAIVAAKAKYRMGWAAKISPFDLTLVWGRLVEPEVASHITYQNDGARWYVYEYDAQFPLPPEYIKTHSSNNHIIPATSGVFDGLKKASHNSLVEITGSLVKVTGYDGNNPVTWVSGLSADSSGSGGCKLILVTGLVVDGVSYK